MDAVIHAAGILFAISACPWILAHVSGASVTVSVSVYCVGLLSMIFASAAYNLTQGRAKEIFRGLDHAAIFLMIAATYTPFAMNRLEFSTGFWLLAAVWVCAAAGMAIKLIYPRRFELASVGGYLLMGWMIVAVVKPLEASVNTADLWLLFAGGALYSLGVVFLLMERLPYHKVIWHGLVLVAVMMHFCAITGEFAT